MAIAEAHSMSFVIHTQRMSWESHLLAFNADFYRGFTHESLIIWTGSNHMFGQIKETRLITLKLSKCQKEKKQERNPNLA